MRTLDRFELLGYCTGNSAVVFEVLADDGRHLRLKCYTRPKDNLEAIYGQRLLKEELYVFTGDGGVWTDVVVDEWIEGTTLGEAIGTAARKGDKEVLAALAGKFDLLVRGMLAREWAHGDLKPDNIIVTDEGELRLIDFDAVYIPSLRNAESRCREVGTAAWQHPSRSSADYDRHMDDYPAAMISTLLHALAVEPSIYDRFADADEMVLDSRRIAGAGCPALEHIERMFAERGMAVQYRVAGLLRSKAYILPQLDEYLSYGGCGGVCRGGEPELVMRNGLYGCTCGGEMVVPPLYDDVSICGDGVVEVVLGGVRHRAECTRMEYQKV